MGINYPGMNLAGRFVTNRDDLFWNSLPMVVVMGRNLTGVKNHFCYIYEWPYTMWLSETSENSDILFSLLMKFIICLQINIWFHVEEHVGLASSQHSYYWPYSFSVLN